MCQFANMPMCQLAALSCRMVIGTLAYWHIDILLNFIPSRIFCPQFVIILINSRANVHENLELLIFNHLLCIY